MNETNMIIDQLGDEMDKVRVIEAEQRAKETHKIQVEDIKRFDLWLLFVNRNGITEAVSEEAFLNDPTLVLSGIRVKDGLDQYWNKEEKKFMPSN